MVCKSLGQFTRYCDGVLTGVRSGILTALILGVIWGRFPELAAQLPAVCAENATRSGVCCPSWKKDGNICGGSDRGRCVKLQSGDDISQVPEAYRHDDRLFWPTRLIQFACECFGNYAGYMCHECRDGFRGDKCLESFVRIRRNLNSLNLTEKQYIIEVMDTARYVTSDYVILNVTHSSDPLRHPQFLEASVFDYLGYLHYYASRLTNLGSEKKCENANFRMDCAHRGSNFPLWHRYYMILWEKEMGKIAGDPTFTFPYWNWVDGGTTCEPCTDEFLGATNMSAPDKVIRKNNRISNWYVLCYILNECETCDPDISFYLVRNPGNNNNAGRLPSAEDVSSFMALNTFDYPDFVIGSRATSFRARMEGYSTSKGPTSALHMHNLVHAFMNGSFSGALTSSFDPVFYLHHSFMDLLLETWLRRTGAGPSQLPSAGAYPGHHRDSYLVPFFPVAKASWYFTTCRHLGYDYDAMYDTKKKETWEESKQNVTSSESGNVTTAKPDVNSLNSPSPSEFFPANTTSGMDTTSGRDTTSAMSTTSVMDTITMATESATNPESVNPLLRYLIIEGAVIVVLLIALVSECAFRFRYFVTHHGYMQLNLKGNQELGEYEDQTSLQDADESDCE